MPNAKTRPYPHPNITPQTASRAAGLAAILGQAHPSGDADDLLWHGPVARGRLRLRTLLVLRWLAITGQTIAVLTVGLGLGFPLPYVWCLSLIAASAWLNIILSLGSPGQRLARGWEAAAQLAFDIAQLAALLYLTGGIANPFSLLLIAPVTLAAATLPGRFAIGLGILAVAATLALSVWALPLPWMPAHGVALPQLYRAGMAIATMTGIGFTAGYAWQASAEAARMELALTVTQSVLSREQRLSALGGLAAAAAHELGTPLATISIVAKEMVRDAPEGPLRDDAELLVSQALRCRDILKRLTREPETDDIVHGRMSLLQFVNEVIEHHLSDTIRVEAVLSGAPGIVAPDIQRMPEVLHALISLVENAVDFASAEVLVTARYDADTVAVEVRDDGPGFAHEVLLKLGEPYVTSRPGGEGSRSGHLGMGLGFFIAKTLLERTGAVVTFRNGRQGGAIVAARWSRRRIEAPTAV
jgi:two-component system sensor histidine kinase RegB